MPMFRVAAVVAVYHDKMMCGFDEFREFLDHMAGESVAIWDIPAAIKLTRKSLDRQFPWLKDFSLDPDVKPDTYPKFVRQMIAQHGSDKMEVQPLKPGQFKATSGIEKY